MNFFGHAAIACRLNREPRFVFGAMLPDLCQMAGVREPEPLDAWVSEGLAHHHLADHVFHESATFRSLLEAAHAQLGALGLRSGPRRAVAHLAIEFILDTYFGDHPLVGQSYLAALDVAGHAPLHQTLSWNDETSLDRLTRVCSLLAERGLVVAAFSPELVERRICRTLAERPRLSPVPSECASLSPWLLTFASTVKQAAPTLEATLHAALGTSGPR